MANEPAPRHDSDDKPAMGMTGMGPMGGPPPGPGGPMGAEVHRAENVSGTLRRMAAYFAKEKALTIGMLVAVCAGVGFGILAPAMQSNAIDIIAGSLDQPFLPALLATVGAYLAYSLCQLAESLVSAHLSQRMIKRLREELFAKVVDLPIGYLDTHSHGDILSRMANDVDSISNTVSRSLASMVSGVLTIVGTISIMLCYCWQLTLLCLATTALSAVASKVIADRMRVYSRRYKQLLGQVNGTVEESVSNFRTITAYGLAHKTIGEFNGLSDAQTKAYIQAEAIGSAMGPIMNCIGNLNFVIIAACGAWFTLQGMMSIGVISAFIVYAKQFGRPINDLGMIYGELQSAVASAERVFALLDQASEDMEGADAASILECDSPAAIEFQQVGFSYVPGRPVIHDLSLSVPAGSRIALVGATGSGKTTVVSLLMRFYDPEQGRILLNGTDIASLSRPTLRRRMAAVLQETTIFDDTVEANLRYGNHDATEQQLWDALGAARSDAMVRSMSKGLGTRLGMGGGSLSHGQRQLLALARAFVANPAILILDEATSNIDTRTERAVQAATERIMQGRTCVIIAHRLSTIRSADRIVVMDQGRIVEQGTYQQLIAAKGRYYQLEQAQEQGLEI